MKWIRTNRNVDTRWDATIGIYTLVVEKTPGFDPRYAVFKGEEHLHGAAIWGGTVKECKKAAHDFYKKEVAACP